MSAVQALLDFDMTITPSIVTLNGMIFMILRNSQEEWWMPWELIHAVRNKYDVLISDSSCTARLRDLRKAQFGAHNIEKRIREGSRAYEYRLGDQP
jgi:hypothetical protein